MGFNMQEAEFQTVLARIRERVSAGELTEASKELLKLSSTLKSAVQRMEVLLDLSQIAIVSGDKDEAKAYWHEASVAFHRPFDLGAEKWMQKHQDPGNRPKRLQFYDVYFTTPTRRNAAKMGKTPFDAFVEEAPNCSEYYLIRGLYFLDAEAHGRAQADLERANALDPNNVLVLSPLAEAVMNLGNTERATTLNERVLSACPSLRRSLVNLGILYCGAHRNEEAYKLFQCLVAYDPMNWFAWTCLGDMFVERKGVSFQSMPYYATAIVTGTTIAYTYVQMAKALCFLGRPNRALEVLDLYSECFSRWPHEHLPLVRYIKLINEILHSPEIAFDQVVLTERMQQLKPRCDHLSLLLFQMLAHAVALNYSMSLVGVFCGHMSCFAIMVQFLNECDARPIYEEEIVLLSLITRYYIWNGFLFEARALISLMSRSDDAQMSDMCGLLQREMYRYCDMAEHAGVRLSEFHERLFHLNEEKHFYRFVSESRVQVSPESSWRLLITPFLSNLGASDIEISLFESRFDSLMEEIDTHAAETGYDASYREFWSLCQLYCSTRGGKKNAKILSERLERLDSEWRRLFDIFKNVYSSSADLESLDEGKRSDTSFKRLLTNLSRGQANNASRELYSMAANDNLGVSGASSLEDALSGYDPLPFTADGTAFQRLLKMNDTFELDESNVDEVLKQILDTRIFMHRRQKTNEALDVRQSPWHATPTNELESRAYRFWKQLHGKESFGHFPILDTFVDPVRRSSDNEDAFFEEACQRFNDYGQASAFGELPDAKDGTEIQDDVLLSLVDWIRSSRSMTAILKASLHRSFDNRAWKLPEQPAVLYPVRCKIQTPPKMPPSTQILKQTVAVGLLTRVDLVEQFFNRAVYAVTEWEKSRNAEALSVFFDEDRLMRFATFEDCAAGDFSNTISWIDDANGLAESLEVAAGELLCDETDARFCDYERFNRGYIEHPFLQQFRKWAELHAEKIFREIARYEAALAHWNAKRRFVLEWQINDMIRRYPYLSRLYLLLAKLYYLVDENDKAKKAFEVGFMWEERLYGDSTWATRTDAEGKDIVFDAVMAGTEFDEQQLQLWQERFVFLGNDESMYHYKPYGKTYPLRYAKLPEVRTHLLSRIIVNDKSGAFDFYRLFKSFFVQEHAVKAIFRYALTQNALFNLKDYLKFLLVELVAPRYFPFRRQVAELYYQLYPEENPGALARFFCDNFQPVNALSYAALSYIMGNENDAFDFDSQGCLTLGCILYDMGYMEAAVEYLGIAVKCSKPVPMALLTLGCAYIELDKNKEAVRVLTEGTKCDPYCDRFYYNLSLAYFSLEKYEEAEAAVRRGIALANYPVDLRLQLMRILVHFKRYTEALPLAQYVITEDPDMFMTTLEHNEFLEFRKLDAVRKIVMDATGDASICDEAEDSDASDDSDNANASNENENGDENGDEEDTKPKPSDDDKPSQDK